MFLQQAFARNDKLYRTQPAIVCLATAIAFLQWWFPMLACMLSFAALPSTLKVSERLGRPRVGLVVSPFLFHFVVIWAVWAHAKVAPSVHLFVALIAASACRTRSNSARRRFGRLRSGDTAYVEWKANILAWLRVKVEIRIFTRDMVLVTTPLGARDVSFLNSVSPFALRLLMKSYEPWTALTKRA